MSTPLLYILAGPNGSGKSTFVHDVLGRETGLPFINADEIARRRWPGAEEEHAYDASLAAAEARAEAMSQRRSFITETVFSHESKITLVRDAVRGGYLVELRVMLIPEEVAVARVAYRVAGGGHTVPDDKIRARYRRLWDLVVEARPIAHRAVFHDNSRRRPFRQVAIYERGELAGEPAWPIWTPDVLTA